MNCLCSAKTTIQLPVCFNSSTGMVTSLVRSKMDQVLFLLLVFLISGAGKQIIKHIFLIYLLKLFCFNILESLSCHSCNSTDENCILNPSATEQATCEDSVAENSGCYHHERGNEYNKRRNLVCHLRTFVLA